MGRGLFDRQNCGAKNEVPTIFRAQQPQGGVQRGRQNGLQKFRVAWVQVPQNWSKGLESISDLRVPVGVLKGSSLIGIQNATGWRWVFCAGGSACEQVKELRMLAKCLCFACAACNTALSSVLECGFLRKHAVCRCSTGAWPSFRRRELRSSFPGLGRPAEWSLNKVPTMSASVNSNNRNNAWQFNGNNGNVNNNNRNNTNAARCVGGE
jgi:hypothetical protein